MLDRRLDGRKKTAYRILQEKPLGKKPVGSLIVSFKLLNNDTVSSAQRM
jgi:hypothetical protein